MKKRSNKKEKVKYLIVIYKNKKEYKVLHKKSFPKTILRIWDDEIRFIKPRFCIEYGKRGSDIKFELALLYPKDKTTQVIYTKDYLGRNKEIELLSEKYKIKKIINYYVEQKIYDINEKKYIRYCDLLNELKNFNELTQLFTLNNKLIILNENYVKMFNNICKKSCDKLFTLLKEDLINYGISNILFVREILELTKEKNYMIY
jgi:hypothetical protein